MLGVRVNSTLEEISRQFSGKYFGSSLTRRACFGIQLQFSKSSLGIETKLHLNNFIKSKPHQKKLTSLVCPSSKENLKNHESSELVNVFPIERQPIQAKASSSSPDAVFSLA